MCSDIFMHFLTIYPEAIKAFLYSCFFGICMHQTYKEVWLFYIRIRYKYYRCINEHFTYEMFVHSGIFIKKRYDPHAEVT